MAKLKEDKISKKTKEKFFKQFPIKKIAVYIPELIREVRGNTNLRGKSQAMDYFESQWDAFLLKEIRSFHIEAVKEVYSSNPIKKRKNRSVEAEKSSEDWRDPLGFLPRLEEKI